MNLSSRERVVTIGNFDGCHRGHKVLITECLRLARARGISATALTFSPSAKSFFRSAASHSLLFTSDHKSKALIDLGLDEVFIQTFDKDFSQLSAEGFVRSLLREKLDARGVVVGENFRFGFQRKGDCEQLERLGKKYDIDVCIVPSQLSDESVISSTKVRVHLEKGEIVQANSLLGQPYVLEGKLEKGIQLGRAIGFPTLNIETSQLVPAHGVYAGWLVVGNDQSLVKMPDNRMPAVCNVGIRPTVNRDGNFVKPTVEIHALSETSVFESDHSDEGVAFYFENCLREEKKFDSLEHLKKQIAKDILDTKIVLGI